MQIRSSAEAINTEADRQLSVQLQRTARAFDLLQKAQSYRSSVETVDYNHPIVSTTPHFLLGVAIVAARNIYRERQADRLELQAVRLLPEHDQ